MSRSSAYTTSTPWRHLDIAQMHVWPTAARRAGLALMALMLMLLFGWLLVLPIFVKWQQTTAKTTMLQQQFTQAVVDLQRQALPYNESNTIGKMPFVLSTEMPIWLSQFAQTAQQNGLRAISVKPVYAMANVAPTAAKDAKKPAVPEVQVEKLPTTEPAVGQVLFTAESSYADVLKWLAALSGRDEIIGLHEIEVHGLSEGRVRFQAQIDFAQGGLP